MAARLAEQIGGEAVADPDPDGMRSPWRTYALALDLTPAWATHRCIIQDDALPCRDFAAALKRAISARPDRVLALFHGGQPRENVLHLDRARDAGHAWAKLRSRRFVPAVALAWPVRLVCPVYCWVAEQGWPAGFRADDEIIGRALNHFGETVLASVPSLVQHEDIVPSLVGRRARGGLDPGRVARHFQPSLPEIDWTSGDA